MEGWVSIIHKYFLFCKSVMEFEDVRVLDELQDGYLRSTWGKEERRAVSLASLPVPSPKGSSPAHRHTFISTDSDSFSRFTILMATFWPVMQWTRFNQTWGMGRKMWGCPSAVSSPLAPERPLPTCFLLPLLAWFTVTRSPDLNS